MNKNDAITYRRKVQKPAAAARPRGRRDVQKQYRKAGPKPTKLNKETKRRIASAIASTPNKTQAARAAGISYGAITRAENDPEVRQYIEDIVEGAVQEAEITVADVLRELKRLALANTARFTRRVGDRLVPDFSRATYADMAAVQELNFDETFSLDTKGDKVHTVYSRVKLHGKQQALDMLCKYFRLYNTEGPGGVPGLPGGIAAQAPSLTVQFVEPKKRTAKEAEE